MYSFKAIVFDGKNTAHEALDEKDIKALKKALKNT